MYLPCKEHGKTLKPEWTIVLQKHCEWLSWLVSVSSVVRGCFEWRNRSDCNDLDLTAGCTRMTFLCTFSSLWFHLKPTDSRPRVWAMWTLIFRSLMSFFFLLARCCSVSTWGPWSYFHFKAVAPWEMYVLYIPIPGICVLRCLHACGPTRVKVIY